MAVPLLETRILGEGVLLGDRSTIPGARRIKSPRTTMPGEVHQATSIQFQLPGAELSLDSIRGGNGFTAYIVEPTTGTFTPSHFDGRHSSSLDFAERPGGRTIVDFGKITAVRAEFLGNPLRDMLLPLMEKQAKKYDPTRQSEPTCDLEQHGTRQVVLAGPVLRTNIFGGLDDFSGGNHPSYGFSGQVMPGMELRSSMGT